jgi:hypothetical protein
MANLNHLCRTLLHAMDTGKRDLEDHVVLQIRAALAQVEPGGRCRMTSCTTLSIATRLRASAKG